MKDIQTSATIKRVLRKHFNVKLTRFDLIHHVDQNRHNNDIRNLMVVTHAEHGLIHWNLRHGIPQLAKRIYLLRWLQHHRQHPPHIPIQVITPFVKPKEVWE